MSTTVKRAVWALLLLICLGVGAFALRGMFAFGDVPISAAPTVSARASTASSTPSAATGSPSSTSASASAGPSVPAATSASSAAASTTTPASPTSSTTTPASPTSSTTPASTEAAAPAVGAASSTATASSSATPTGTDSRMTKPAASWERITAAPVHIDVYADGEQVVGAPVELVQTRDDGELNPDPQMAGWYGPPQWTTTPGERSAHPGVIAGHVIHSGLKDVFWNLQTLKAGSIVVITYDDGTQAEFRTDFDVRSMDKDDLTQSPDYAWAWELPEAGNKVTLITCDLVDGSGMTGWSTNNWVTQATRIG
ncbi:class F sortase [Micrococcus porci]|uniref:class F sortase n=1 Tax=Micrococcus porci TaxID=2856555 RepID=UPI001CCA99AA|nr:class F sortase [Micrococcus porci]UBH23999.1 class F sortase [Micrococcus porci]